MPDSTPDFDSMSPEELMQWMESLAKRQGASEGFTTAADMQVAEIDPSTVQIDEPGYTPGAGSMSAEKWKQAQEEDAARVARKPAAPVPAPLAAAPPPPAPTPAAAPAAEAAQPDFDSMSPEELMQWMESLAKRQGASEGFTTAADMQVAEIDPSTVHIDEPGYTPGAGSMSAEKWKQAQEEDAARISRKTAPLPPPAAPPTPAPAPAAFMPEAEAEPAFELPGLNIEDEFDLEIADTALASPAQDDAMAWLETLAADQSVPQLDLSSLGAELDSLAPPIAAESAATDPLAWLEGLAQGDNQPAEAPSAFEPAAAQSASMVADPLESGEDPVKWLETLAKRQGVSEEELVTNADMSIPVPDSLGDAGPGYKEYSFEHEVEAEAPVSASPEHAMVSTSADLSDLDDPETWLDQLASAQGFEPQVQKPVTGELSDTDMVEALNKGKNISPDDIAAWMNRQFDRAETVDEEEEAFDPDAPAVKAELPDWLLEQMGTPPSMENIPAAETVEESWTMGTPAAFEELPAAEAASETPDWLAEQMPQGILDDLPTLGEQPALVDSILEPELPDWLSAEPSEDMSIENIFAQEDSSTAATVTATPGTPLEVDTNDPWVVAFEEERAQNLKDTTTVPAWYTGSSDTPVPSTPTAAPAAALQPAALPPESELTAGVPEAMPDWLSDLTEEVAPAVAGDMPDWLKQQVATDVEPAVAGDLPDWLKEAVVAPQEVPDWLVETLDTNEQAAVPTVPAAAAPPLAPAPLPRPAFSPVPVPAAAQIDVAATLNAARSKWSGGDIANSLQDYEAVIRANTQLDTVVGDLSKAVEDKTHKENPAIYRVLGDGLMRQGKLQAALDTYRKALNLL